MHSTTGRPIEHPLGTTEANKKPNDPNEQSTTPDDCGEPPKKPQGPTEPKDSTKKPTTKPEDHSHKPPPPTDANGQEDPEDDDDYYYNPCEWYEGPRAVPECIPIEQTKRISTMLPNTEAPVGWRPVVPNGDKLTEICAYWPKGKKVKKRTCKQSLKKTKGSLKQRAPTSAAP